MAANKRRKRKIKIRQDNRAETPDADAQAEIPFAHEDDAPTDPPPETTEEAEAASTDTDGKTPLPFPGAAATDAPEEGGDAEAVVPVSTLRAVEAERDRYLDLAKRTRAEFENYRKRTSREHAEMKRASLSEFLRGFFSALDDLDRTLAEGEKSGDFASFLEGVRLVRENLWKVMEEAGVRPIAALGERFDPTVHEAMTALPSPEAEPNTVVEVFQPGYRLDDFVLRPARVIVAAPTPE